MRRRLRRPSPAMVVACLALFVALGGTALATVKPFSLGTTNTVDAATTVTNGSTSIATPLLTLKNLTTGTGGTALALNVASGHAPFTTNSATRVTNLNADKLDGKDSTAFLQSCPSPLTGRYGRICVGSDGGSRTWIDALKYCAGYGLRLPSPSEAYTLASNYDVPGVATGAYFWTDSAWREQQTGGTYTYAHAVSDGRGTADGVDMGWREIRVAGPAVCVTDPANS